LAYLDALKANDSLISRLGEGNAHLIWSMGLYLEEPDLEALASEALTDGPNDKKIDFIYLDQDGKRLLFAQGYFSKTSKEAAPANKASDLNTAAAWLFSGDTANVPDQLRPAIEECRRALSEGDVEAIELLYVHNLPESVNVNRELQTVAAHVRKALGDDATTRIISRELGSSAIEHLFSSQESHIEVKEEIACPAKVQFSESGAKWKASVLSVPGSWLHGLFSKHGDALFSANYRGFLGITKRRRINTGIRQSAELKPTDFWVFNNGITLLTLGMKEGKDDSHLTGISIINGAQTTGSIGSVDMGKHGLKDVKVLCRVIQCTDPDTISEIVRYNNTQNEITTWDQYSNDPEQNRIAEEFCRLGHVYSRKRGFRTKGDQIGIEEVAQPLLAFHGKFQDASRSKNQIFERKPLYRLAFEGKKAGHILFVYTLARAIDERRIELKTKSNERQIISLEEDQLALLRNLRFKNFLISVIGRCLEPVLNRKVDLETVTFTSEAANAGNNSLVALAAAWTPVVEAIISFVATKITAPEFTAREADEALVEEVSKHVSALLYASKSTLSLQSFTRLVLDSASKSVSSAIA
jgi:hypothetical protein